MRENEITGISLIRCNYQLWTKKLKELLVMQYPTILPISPEIVEVPGLELSEVELLVITAQGMG